MELEISPEPDAGERAAIEAALGLLADELRAALEPPPSAWAEAGRSELADET